MKAPKFICGALIALSLAGCADGYGPKQTGGALLGGALGGLLGSQIGGGTGNLVATAGLAALGLVIGSNVGRSLDRADAVYLQNSTANALEYNQIGQPVVWQNNQVYTTVVPVRDGSTTGGRYCREYQQTVTVGGKTEQAYGTACRQPDGAWQVVNGSTSSTTTLVVQPQTTVVQRPVVVQPYHQHISVYDVPDYQPYGVYPYYPLGYAWSPSYRWHYWSGSHWHHHH